MSEVAETPTTARDRAREEMWAIFHHLWGLSKLGRYEKREWKELQQRLADFGL